MNVACVLRSGGPYGPLDVQRLQAGVAKHLPAEHRFVCFSDVDIEGVERIPLAHDWPRWWPKIEALGAGLRGLTMLMDLDTIIVGDLSPFAAYTGRRAMLRDFYRSELGASGVMLWWDDAFAGVYNSFARDPAKYMAQYRSTGDGGFSRETLPGFDFVQDLWPGLVVSFKVHCINRRANFHVGRVPNGARVVCFHGKPRPNDLPAGHWIWKAVA